MTLVEFLTARLDEDVEAAKRVRQPYRLYVDDDGRISEPKHVEDWNSDRDGEYEQWADGDDRMPNHIANWALIYDPARVLREVEAKRRVVEEYKQAYDNRRAHPDDLASAGALLALHGVVKLLALPYAEHADYDQAWRP